MPSTSIKVRGYKPSALVFAASSEVQVQRTFADLEKVPSVTPAVRNHFLKDILSSSDDNYRFLAHYRHQGSMWLLLHSGPT